MSRDLDNQTKPSSFSASYTRFSSTITFCCNFMRSLFIWSTCCLRKECCSNWSAFCSWNSCINLLYSSSKNALASSNRSVQIWESSSKLFLSYSFSFLLCSKSSCSDYSKIYRSQGRTYVESLKMILHRHPIGEIVALLVWQRVLVFVVVSHCS